MAYPWSVAPPLPQSRKPPQASLVEQQLNRLHVHLSLEVTIQHHRLAKLRC